MSLIFSDSFDEYSAKADFSDRYNSITDDTTMNFLSTGGRFGGGAVQFTDDGGELKKLIDMGTVTAFRLAFWMKISSSSDGGGQEEFIKLLDDGGASGDNWELRIDDDGSIGITEFDDTGLSIIANSLNTFRDDTFHHVELHFELGTSAGTIELWVDGTKEIDRVGDIDTNDSTSTDFSNINTFMIASPGASFDTIDATIDDPVLWIEDATGLTGQIGEHQLSLLVPNATGSSAQFAVTGATNNFEAVDETPSDDDTTYVESGTTGEKDLYNYEAIPVSTSNVISVGVWGNARNPDAGTIQYKHVVSSSSTEASSAAFDLTASYSAQFAEFFNDPNTASSWTVAAVDAAEFGIEVV